MQRTAALALTCMIAGCEPAPPAAPHRPSPAVAPRAASAEPAAHPFTGAVETTGYATCFVRRDGRVFCWGDVTSPNGDSGSPLPFELDGVRDAVQVSLTREATGWFDGCIVGKSGEVRCWGANGKGQVDPAKPETARKVPTAVAGVGASVEVRAMPDRACAVGTDGALTCWSDAAPAPYRVAGVGDVVSISSLGACAVRRDGTVACAPKTRAGGESPLAPGAAEPWSVVPGVQGAMRVVEIGTYRIALRRVGPPAFWDAGVAPPVVTALPALEDAIDIQGQTFEDPYGKGPPSLSVCILQKRGTLACTADARKSPGKELAGYVDAVSLAHDPSFNCTVRTNGELWCGGDRGSIGIDRKGTVDRPEPGEVPGLADVVELHSGRTHTCVRQKSGKVLCWGPFEMDAPDGALVRTFGATPTPVEGVTDAVSLATSDVTACAVRRDGSVVCWGTEPAGFSGPYGTLPSDRFRKKEPPRGVVAVLGLRDIVNVSVGSEVCGVTRAGRVMCWSRASEKPAVLRTIEGIDDAVESAFVYGDAALCVVRRTGAVACGREGKLRPVASLAAGAHFASGLMVRRDGTLAAVTLSLRDDPVQGTPVDGVRDVKAADGNVAQGCVVGASGTVACWGRNDHGQLGDGTHTTRAAPAPVRGLDDAIAVVVAERHACALRKAGTVVCWGSRLEDRLGTGENVAPNAKTPLRIPLP